MPLKRMLVFALLIFVFFILTAEPVKCEVVYIRCNRVFIQTKNHKLIVVNDAILGLSDSKVEILSRSGKRISAKRSSLSKVQCMAPQFDARTASRIKKIMAGSSGRREDGKSISIEKKVNILDVLKIPLFLLLS